MQPSSKPAGPVIWPACSLSIQHPAFSLLTPPATQQTPVNPSRGLTPLFSLSLFCCSRSQGPEDHHDPNESPRWRHRSHLGAGLPGQCPHVPHPHGVRGSLHPHQRFEGALWPPSWDRGGLGSRVTVPTLVSPACRTKSSPSPSSRGPVWGADSWTAAPNTLGRSWCWSGYRPSSTAPCTAAPRRTPWAPPTPTPASSSSVWHHCITPSLRAHTLPVPPNPPLCCFSPLENPNIPRGTEDSNGKWWPEEGEPKTKRCWPHPTLKPNINLWLCKLSFPFLPMPRFSYRPLQLQTSFGAHPNSDPGANVKLHSPLPPPLPLYGSTRHLHLCQLVISLSLLCYLQSRSLSVCVLAFSDNLIKRKKKNLPW